MEQVHQINSWITYSRVTGNRISVDLPKEFDAQEVQIIIIPKNKGADSGLEEWKNDFRSISKWDISENEIRIKSWPVTEF